jgi:hypothetical protein
VRQNVVRIQTKSRSHYHSTKKAAKRATNETFLATGVDPAASGGIIAQVKDGRKMTRVYSIVITCIYCRRIVNNYAGHFKDINRYIFAPLVVGESCSFDNLGWIFQIPPKIQVGAPTTS